MVLNIRKLCFMRMKQQALGLNQDILLKRFVAHFGKTTQVSVSAHTVLPVVGISPSIF